MVNEVTKVELFGANRDGEPRTYDVASNAAIPKGTLLVLSNTRDVAAHGTTVGAYCGGVAAMEKENDDYSITISAWTQGIFSFRCSGAITTGHPVKSSSAANRVEAAAESIMGSAILGYAVSTGVSGAIVEVRVNL